MNMGLLDLPAPALDALDALLAAIAAPAALRVLLYAAACGWISMAMYRRWSDQDRIVAVRAEISQTQADLAGHDGGFGELNKLILKNLKLTLRQLGMTLRPALFASLPVLFLLPWLSNTFALTLPTAAVRVCAEPAPKASVLQWQPDMPTVSAGCWNVTLPARVVDEAQTLLAQLRTRPKSEVIQKFAAFNMLIGNPNGYLPGYSPVARLTLALTPRELLPFGPVALRGWEPLFFGALIFVSLLLKRHWQMI